MADWSTVAIAGITAVAGLGGTVLTGRFNMRALIKSHRRDDTTMMRTKIEELFSELDVIEAANSKHYPLAFAMARGHTPPEPIAAINFGKLRAIVALYFPDLQSAVDEYDQNDREWTKELRARIEAGESAMVAGGQHVLLQAAGRAAFCDKMRRQLASMAGTIGESVRASAELMRLKKWRVRPRSGGQSLGQR